MQRDVLTVMLYVVYCLSQLKYAENKLKGMYTATMDTELRQAEKLGKLKELVRKEITEGGVEKEALEDALWDALVLLEGKSFETAKHLDYSYAIKGYEMFVSRKDKSITRSTVNLSLWNAMQLQKAGLPVSGPKKLKTFGASYLYPIFVELGVIL